VIVDAHNDVLLELVPDPGGDPASGLVLRRGGDRLFDRYWLPRLGAGGVGVQVCPLYAANVSRPEARDRALAQAVEFGRAVEANAQRVCQVRTRAQLEDPRLRLVLSMEGVEALQGDPRAFEEWYGLGVRSASLTWNGANEFAGGIYTPGQRLTDRGRRSRASAEWRFGGGRVRVVR
jgi:membrane dipeptidase